MSPEPRPEALPRSSEPTETWTWEHVVRALLAHARRLGASDEEAEDLVQESVERTVRDPHWHDPSRGSLLSLLRTVVRNRWIDRHRATRTHERATPSLRLVTDTTPLAPARGHRAAFLASLTQDERQLFELWLRQRAGELDAHAAARSLGLDVPAYEAAKKRLRRRCRAVLEALELDPQDLFDGGDA